MTRDDPYRSREASSWARVPRQDPVLWGSGEGGPLSPGAVEGYVEAGFVVLPGLLGAEEVAALREAGAALKAALPPDAPEVVREPDSAAIRSIFAIHRHSPPLAALAADPRLAGAARQLLGGPVYLHQARLNYKPGFAGRRFDWHSDFETWHVEDGMPRMRALSAVVLLRDNHEHNGPLMLIPGSHRQFVRCVGRTPPDNHQTSLRRQVYGVPEPPALEALIEEGGLVSVEAAAGAVVLFDCNTMHASGPNLSPWARDNVFFVYNSVENRLGAPPGGTAPRPEHIAARAHTAPLP